MESSQNIKHSIIPDSYSINQSVLNKSRADKYIMVLTLPKILLKIKSRERNNATLDFDSLQFSIYGYPMPNIEIPSIGVKYQGQEIQISSHSRSSYSTVSVDFKIDNLFRNWWVIYKWLNLLNDEKLSFYDRDNISEKDPWNALKEYSTNFTVYGMDEYDNKVIKFDYTGCIPISLTNPQHSDQNTEELMSGFTFSFSFFDSTLI